MRVVTWNMHGARASRQPAWEYLLELKPDIALLQEVGEIPLQVAAQFECKEAHAVRQNGRTQKFKTALLVRGRITDDVVLLPCEQWIALLPIRSFVPSSGPPPAGMHAVPGETLPVPSSSHILTGEIPAQVSMVTRISRDATQAQGLPT